VSDFERDLAMAAETGTVRLDASVVDLFSGAGGLSLGLAAGGLRVLAASDAWKSAAATYSHNFSNHVFVQTDARDLTAASLKVSSGLGTEPLILVGGPPCQGFSSAGARRAGDHRNSLVAVFAKLAAALGPEVVVFENVEGFLTADAGNFVLDLLDPLIESGYQIQVRKVNVANFGVPQLRKRVICIVRQPTLSPRIEPLAHQVHGGWAGRCRRRGLSQMPWTPSRVLPQSQETRPRSTLLLCLTVSTNFVSRL
jgi:DNA (cytosine-5)-methyltransferase 1